MPAHRARWTGTHGRRSRVSSPTWLDRAIGWMSPERGARRVHARMMMQTLAYEGAKPGRRREGWITHSTDADGESQAVVHTLRDSARDLVRNNPYAASAVDVKVTETIGSGIMAEVRNKRLDQMWNRWITDCDADERSDFYGIQALVERCRMESGECLIRFVPVERTAAEIRAGYLPFKLRILEPDYIDASRDGKAPDSGNVIRYGIEYDGAQRPVAYWLFDEHPGSSGIGQLLRPRGLSSSRVPAHDVIHIFRQLRAGQSRGVTDFAPVMMRLRDLDDYDDAEIMRKKLEACLAAFVTSPNADGSPLQGPLSTDATGRVQTLYPAMIEYLRPGEGVETAEPKAAGGYADFKRFAARDIATGIGIPYELMTGDLSQVNYSSYRAGLIRFRRRLEQDQWHLYVPRLCERVAERFRMEARGMTGMDGLGERSRFEWTPPRFELHDPLKETQAEIEAISAGLDPWEEVVRRRGWSSEDMLDALERWQKALDKRGIIVKSDYRTQVGGMVSQATPPEPDDDDSDQEAA